MTGRLSDHPGHDLLRRIAGFFRERSTDAYVVGGTVRDWLLARPSQDLDLAVAGDALHLTRALADALDAAYVPLDIERATARVVLRRPVGARPGGLTIHQQSSLLSALSRPYVYVDVAQLRGGTLETDLANRDFTVNAMAVSLEDAAAGRLNIVDVLDGQGDLQASRLRATSESALRDDPLRMLRAVRLAAELDFTIEPQTLAWIAARADVIRSPAPERVRDELVRLFACPGTAGYLGLMDELGLLAPLFPELVAGKGVTQPPMHQWDVFEHSLMAVRCIDRLYDMLGLSALQSGTEADDPDGYARIEGQLQTFAPQLLVHLQSDVIGGRQRFVLLKLLTLLHDVGKPDTRSVDEAGGIHFYGHEQVGADMVATILRRLHFGAREVQIGRTVTCHHMRPKWLAGAGKVTRRAVYRFFRDTGDSGVDVVVLSLADTLALTDAPPDDASCAAQLDITQRLLDAWFEHRDRMVAPPALIRGTEVMDAFDLEPGPIIGELLEAVREAQATGGVSTRDEALSFAERWLTDQQPTTNDA